MSTIANADDADIIVAMDQGRIVEVGTHEELMSKQNFYFDMVERQRRSFGIIGEPV